MFDVSILTYVFLTIVAFIAGFVDAIVGGGGLIMVPSFLVSIPSASVAQAVGTIKIPAFSGIIMAATQYLRKSAVKLKIVIPSCLLAFGASFLGSYILTKVSNDFMKPVLLGILTLVAIYTFIKKDFGNHTEKKHSESQQILFSCMVALVVGFYDGFIGPGGGSFFVLGFIVILGFNFLQATTYAKLANGSTNLASIIILIIKGKIIWTLAIPMAIAATIGSLLGARYALTKDNSFIRKFFLCIVIIVLLRFAYDVFGKF
jgi:uncharacterized protein